MASQKNHTQETVPQVNTADALQAIACASMEDKEAMVKLTSINLTLSQSLTQSQETMLVLSKQLQALQVHTKANTSSTKRTALDKKTRILNRIATAGLMGEHTNWNIPAQPEISPRQDNKQEQPLGTIWEKARSGTRRKRPANRMEGRETLW